MNISGVRPIAKFYDYKNEAVKKAMSQAASLALKNMDNEFVNIDMERAIQRMQKDYAIHQYQCFVGDKRV